MISGLPARPGGPLAGLLGQVTGGGLAEFTSAVLAQRRVDMGDSMEVQLGTSLALALWMLTAGQIGQVQDILRRATDGDLAAAADHYFKGGRTAVQAMQARKLLWREARQLDRQLWREQHQKARPTVLEPVQVSRARVLPLPSGPRVQAS